MAKRGKRRRKPLSTRRSISKIRDEIEEAMVLVEEEGYGAALDAATSVNQKVSA